MDSIVINIHSGIRWLVLLLAVIVISKSITGLVGKSEYTKTDKILGASFTGSIELQFLLGLILYIFLSPITQLAFNDFGAAMKDSNLRFWAVEHITMMILATAAASIGRSKAKKAEGDTKKFKLQLIFYGVSFILIIVAIPWARLWG